MNMQNQTAEHGLAAQMDDLRKGIEAASASFEADTPATASSLERFQAAIERQRESLRKRMLANESQYEIERTQLVDAFRVRLRNLQHEAGEALRAFELRHHRKAVEDRKLFDALDAARGQL